MKTSIAYAAAVVAALSLPILDGMAVSAQAQSYRDMSCGELWYARNAIYADAGHCFQTARGRRAFGRGCFPPYGRLSRSEQREVARIQRWENIKGCR